jgi:hypothetical protein
MVTLFIAMFPYAFELTVLLAIVAFELVAPIPSALRANVNVVPVASVVTPPLFDWSFNSPTDGAVAPEVVALRVFEATLPKPLAATELLASMAEEFSAPAAPVAPASNDNVYVALVLVALSAPLLV